jgi:replicative DNA helicase
MVPQARDDAPARTGRVPPHSEEAERGVLGSALLDADRVIDLCIERRLSAEAFYIPWHRALFDFLVQIHNEGRPIDLLTVSERLRTLGQLEQVGGEGYIERLIDGTPTAAHAEYYIDLVRQKHMLRSIIDRSREAIDACYEGVDNADTILDASEQALYDIAEFQTSGVIPWSQAIKESMEHIEKIMQLHKDVTGVPTGYLDLDKITHGLQPGDLVIIAARPSMGKTSLAMNIAENAALGAGPDRKRHAVAIFSLEMSRESLVKRMLCSRAGVPSHKLSGGYISAEHHSRLVQAADALSQAQIYVDDSAGLTPIDVRARARRLKRKFGIELVVVDYLQMMNFPQFARDGRQRETAAISGAMKAMAKELRIPVVVLSQLSRAPETRDRSAVPKLSDLRDSGSIEQDADVVCLLRRPCKYPQDDEFQDKTLAILDVAKQRNGPTGEIRLNFIEELTRFENRAEGVDRPETFQPSSGGMG